MNRIKSPDELRKMKDSFASGISIREKGERSEDLTRIRVAMGACGIAAGAREVMNILFDKVETDGIPAVVMQTDCMGCCDAEPTVEVHKPGEEPVVFGCVDAARCAEIIELYVVKGEMPGGVITPGNTKNTNP